MTSANVTAEQTETWKTWKTWKFRDYFSSKKKKTKHPGGCGR